MTKKIIHNVAESAKELGFLNDTAYKYYCVCERYNELRQQNMKEEKIENVLSKEFKMQPETIHDIYCRKAKQILNPEIIKFASLDEPATNAVQKH